MGNAVEDGFSQLARHGVLLVTHATFIFHHTFSSRLLALEYHEAPVSTFEPYNVGYFRFPQMQKTVCICIHRRKY